jgi:hypothetical protein
VRGRGDPGDVLAGLAQALFARVGATPSGPPLALLDRARPVAVPLPEGVDLDGPALLGRAHEALLDRAARRRGGVFYTPPPVARALVVVAGGQEPGRVCDPAAGGGSFLLAAADHAESLGADPGTIVAERTYGIDVDPLAVAVAEAALVLWATSRGAPRARPAVVVADTLQTGLDAWRPAARPFDLVVGNPPFQGQLARETARSGTTREALRSRLGPVAQGYADTASLFLVVACRMTRPGGRVALVLPESILAARDAGPMRADVRERAAITGIWYPGVPVFGAGVRVCAPVLDVAVEQGAVDRWVDAGARPTSRLAPHETTRRLAGDAGRSWAPLVADLGGVPPVDIDSGATLASIATTTAGFRDQYYGIEPFVGEGSTASRRWAPLVTSGAIDPLRCSWGHRPTRFAGRSWARPVVDLDALAEAQPAVARWATGLARPKVLVAAQTRVVEACIDEQGDAYPSVPVIAVLPRADGGRRATPAHLAAVLLAPPVSAWAAGEVAGAALADGALKLSARLLLAIPLPSGEDEWDEAAAAIAGASVAATAGDRDAWSSLLDRAARIMVAAYGSGEAVWSWWRARRPDWR